MFKGFYNLTSGMLSQERRLDIVANNMTNTATAGYKTDRYTDSTFEEYLVSRIDQGRTSTQLGGESYILAPSQVYTDFTQGVFETTGLPLDFAIQGDGFFAVETADGVAYTRAGNFCLDDEGYLCLAEQGRVLNPAGDPILLITDDITADAQGGLYTGDGGLLGQIGVFTFADNAQLERNDQGLFVNGGQPTGTVGTVVQKSLERSNVDLVQQMVSMMTSQRALQSAAQLTKIYDEVMTKSTTNLGQM